MVGSAHMLVPKFPNTPILATLIYSRFLPVRELN